MLSLIYFYILHTQMQMEVAGAGFEPTTFGL